MQLNKNILKKLDYEAPFINFFREIKLNVIMYDKLDFPLKVELHYQLVEELNLKLKNEIK
jgi:hypothetical protein